MGTRPVQLMGRWRRFAAAGRPRPQTGKTERTKLFVVLTRGRTGSTPLVADINQHQDVVCHQEMFRAEPAVSPFDLAASYEAAVAQHGQLGAREYLDRLTRSAGDGQMVGLKVLDSQLNERAGIDLRGHLLRTRTPIVLIDRHPARAALSAAIATARGAYNLHVDTQNPEYRKRLKTRVTVDPDFAVQEARYYAHWAAELRRDLQRSRARYIEIFYEDYTSRRLEEVNRIFDFLGISRAERLGDNPYSRVTSQNVWDDVVNSDEVSRAFRSAGMELPTD